MRVRLFGGVAVATVDGEASTPVTAPMARKLLALLGARAGTPVPEHALLDALWGEHPPPSARTALQTHVSTVRDLLEPDRPRRAPGRYIHRSAAGYSLAAGEEDLDLACFERTLDRARDAAATGDDRWAVELLDRALDLSGRPPFDELAGEPWALPVIARVHERRGSAFESRFGLALDRGAEQELLDRMHAAADEFPHRERLVAQLALALYRCGDQHRALQVLARARDRFRDDLGLDPGRELHLLEHAILEHDPSLRLRSRAARPPGSRLRRPTSLPDLVGRRSERDEVTELVRTHRLVTLTGPGGAGKTTLAAHVAEALGHRFDGGVHTVDLTDAANRDVLRAVAARVRVVEHRLAPLADALVDAMGDRPTLLVVETCEVATEQVAEAVSALLTAPGLRVLATSQVPLHVQGERVHRLAALDAGSAATILAGGRPATTAEERSALVGIADRLDRLPLALELTRSRLEALGAVELERLLRTGGQPGEGGVDRPQRHRSVQAAAGWGVDLLGEHQGLLLERLTAHAAPFTASTAAALWGTAPLDGPSVGALLGDLVERSLVSRLPGSPVRFRLLAGVRQVVLGRAHTDSLVAARARLADAVVVAAQANAFGSEVELRLIPDLADEVLPTVTSLCERRDGRELSLVAVLGAFAIEQGRISEVREVLRHTLDAHEGPPLLRALICAQAGFLAWYQGDLHETRRVLEEVDELIDRGGLDLLRPAVDGCTAFVERRYDVAQKELERAIALITEPTKQRMMLSHMAGNAALYAGDLSGSARHYRHQRDIAEQVGDPFNVAQALRFEAVVRAHQGDVETAWRWADRSLVHADGSRDAVSVAQSRAAAALVAQEAEQLDVALDHAQHALEGSTHHFDVFALRTAVPVVAAAAHRSGDPHRAARLLGWYQDLLERTGQPHWPTVERLVHDTLAEVRRVLGRDFAPTASVGATSSLAAMIEDAAGRR